MSFYNRKDGEFEMDMDTQGFFIYMERLQNQQEKGGRGKRRR